MSIRLAALAAAIGLFAVVAAPAFAQEGKPVELADGLKYTDTKVGDGADRRKRPDIVDGITLDGSIRTATRERSSTAPARPVRPSPSSSARDR